VLFLARVPDLRHVLWVLELYAHSDCRRRQENRLRARIGIGAWRVCHGRSAYRGGGFFPSQFRNFQLVVLDWMLPGQSGIEILKTLRSRGNKTPVLLLTARDAVDDRVLGLESGADDYLVKTFAFAELFEASFANHS
jgi:CheY-like chemotaxis protein